MRKSFKWFFAAALCALVAIGCAKQGDLDKIVERVDGIENRVGALENAVKQLNEEDVPGLKTLVSALQRQITVASVVEDEDGYVINFSDGTVAVIRNGKNGKDGTDGVDGVDGKDGTDGKDGKDATTPTVGIKLVNGVYYWTVNGELLLDDTGYPIPVTGNDGTDGTDGKDGKDGKDGITPLFGILDGHWVVSYDNGDNWKTLGLTSDTDYSAYIDPDKETDDYIVLVVGATEVQIPKEKAFTLTFTTIKNNGVEAGKTAEFPYAISGVNASDETDVDVIGIMGDWTAEVVPADNATGVLNVTATETASAKITVYAANHKGKTDIRTLVFEAGVLEAVIETKDIEWEGGELDLAVKTNLSYEISVPASAKDWITVTPATKVRTDNYTIAVAKNETGVYRTATVKVLNSLGRSVKDIEILQYANPEAATDLESVLDLPDGKSVVVNEMTVVAASKTSTVITDGEAFAYVANYSGTPGKVVSMTGTKKTDDLGVAYIEPATIAEVEAEPAKVDTKENYLYYGVGANGYDFYYTAANGVLAFADGVYTIAGYEAPQQFVLEDPKQDLSALVGKPVAFSGWVKTVDYVEGTKEDIILVVTDMKEIVFTAESNWKPYYGGPNSGNSNYPEIIGNEVTTPQDGVYYALAVAHASDVEAAGSLEALLVSTFQETSDNVLYYIWYYNAAYDLDYDTAFSYLAFNESDYDYFTEFDFGIHYAIAVGVDAEGRLTGKYAITPFEKKDPRIALKYEDFLGTWTVGGAEWTISQKVAGESYNIDGMQGASSMASRGGNTTVVAGYDAETGSLFVPEQEMAAYDDPSSNKYGPLKDYLSGMFSSGSKVYPNFPTNGDAAVLFSIYGLDDGTHAMYAGECEYGSFYAYRFRWIIQTGSYAGLGNTYNTTNIPMSVKKVNKVAGKYEDFLGSWTVGEDTWVITAKKSGETYSVAGIYGSNLLYSGGSETIEARFDAENGEFYIMDQKLGEFNSDDIPSFANNPYGMCSDNVCGIFVYSGSAYSGYPNNGLTTPARIVTGALDPSGKVDLTPATCRYGVYAALGFSWSILTGESAGMGNYYSKYVLELPATMVKATGSASTRQAAQTGPAVVGQKFDDPSEKAFASERYTKTSEETGAPARVSLRYRKF